MKVFTFSLGVLLEINGQILEIKSVIWEMKRTDLAIQKLI